MQIDWPQPHENALAQIYLTAGQSVIAQEEAILAADQQLRVTPHFGHGPTKDTVLPRFYHYQAQIQPTKLWLTPSLAGCLEYILVGQEGLKVRMESLIACSPGLDTDQSWRGLEAPLGKPHDWLALVGDGSVLVSGFGNLYPLQVDGEHLVNPAKVIAYQGDVNYRKDEVTPTRWQTLTGLKGLTCCAYGAGILWCQSHHPNLLAAHLAPRLHGKRQGNGRAR